MKKRHFKQRAKSCDFKYEENKSHSCIVFSFFTVALQQLAESHDSMNLPVCQRKFTPKG